MLHEQASPTVASWSSNFSAQNFPASVLLPEQRDEYRPLLHMSKEDKTSQVQILSIYWIHQISASLNPYNEILQILYFVVQSIRIHCWSIQSQWIKTFETNFQSIKCNDAIFFAWMHQLFSQVVIYRFFLLSHIMDTVLMILPRVLLQAMLSTRQMDTVTVHEENNTENADQVVLDFRKHLHHWPNLQYL